MTSRRFRKLAGYLPQALIPGLIKNTYISIRFKSFISLRAVIYHSARVKIGRSCIIDACLIDADTNCMPGITIGDACLIHRNTVLRAFTGSITIGDNVSVQFFTVLYGAGNTNIGDNVMIASHCAIGVAQHHFGSKDVPICDQGFKPLDTRIERDVWIGAHVTVFSGVTIGEGSVIGAGAVVTHDIPPFSVAVGIPARVIRRR